MSIAIVTLSEQGALLGQRLAQALPNSRIFVHENAPGTCSGERFSSLKELTSRIVREFKGLVYVAPCGAVVRALAPHLVSKTQDPGVVVVDVMARWAISLLSGHEGGGNALAIAVGNALSAEPIISTTTEAARNIIVGIGCRLGTSGKSIVGAVRRALGEAGVRMEQVRFLSSAQIKAQEPGLLEAARELGVPLRIIGCQEIRACSRQFSRSDLVKTKVNLPAVAEPCALLAGRRTRLLLPKRTYRGVAVAVAEEGSL